jgi:hypothetical protein
MKQSKPDTDPRDQLERLLPRRRGRQVGIAETFKNGPEDPHEVRIVVYRKNLHLNPRSPNRARRFTQFCKNTSESCPNLGGTGLNGCGHCHVYCPAQASRICVPSVIGSKGLVTT